jgi:hypothetical protein
MKGIAIPETGMGLVTALANNYRRLRPRGEDLADGAIVSGRCDTVKLTRLFQRAYIVKCTTVLASMVELSSGWSSLL